MYYTDKELLDFLQSLTAQKQHTGKVVCRWSTGVRGWRLHESTRPGGVPDVRQAIKDFMDKLDYVPLGRKIHIKCRTCSDQKKVREFIAQDESVVIPCPDCIEGEKMAKLKNVEFHNWYCTNCSFELFTDAHISSPLSCPKCKEHPLYMTTEPYTISLTHHEDIAEEVQQEQEERERLLTQDANLRESVGILQKQIVKFEEESRKRVELSDLRAKEKIQKRDGRIEQLESIIDKYQKKLLEFWKQL